MKPYRTEVITEWLRETDPDRVEQLRREADLVRKNAVGDVVYLRGLLEFSNHCRRNCCYCGLRRDNNEIGRYRMTREEILDCVAKAYARGYGTVVLQSGQDNDVDTMWMGEIVRKIKKAYPLAVALSLGVRDEDEYIYWRDMGADRYILRFETSDLELLYKIHPVPREDLPRRIELLSILKGMGYQVGGGILVGLPGQTYTSVANDIELFAKLDLDMVALRPYVPHPQTPLGKDFLKKKQWVDDQIPNDDMSTLKVIALTRIMCPEANIPATNALASIDPCGFKDGLRFGANMNMPNMTPRKYRRLHKMHPNAVLQSSENLYVEILEAIEDAGRYPGHGRGDRVKRQHPKLKPPEGCGQPA